MTNIETFAFGPGQWLWPWVIALGIWLAIVAAAHIVPALLERMREKKERATAGLRPNTLQEAPDQTNDRPESHRRAA